MKFIKSLVLLLVLSFFLVGCKGAEKFTVTFKNGDTVITSVEVKKGEDATAPAAPIKTGFTFTNWDKAFTNVEGDLVVKAVFTVNTFEVQFKVDDMVYGEVVTVEYGQDATLPTAPVKNGFVFTGWDKEAKNVTANLVVNAEFDVATYSVVFRVDGVQVGETQTITHGEAAEAPTDPVKLGHTFIGWDEDFDNVKGDLIVSAEFEALTFTVRFYLDETNMIGEPQTVSYGQAAGEPNLIPRIGFIFTGWDKEFDNITADLDVTAMFDVAVYTVEFLSDGARIGVIQNIEYGEAAIAPPINPEKIGYNFTEWDKAFDNVKSNLVINAVYSVLTYDIKYFNGTTELFPSPATYTVETAVEYAAYEMTGFAFLGWFETEALLAVTTGITKGSVGSVTVYAKLIDETLEATYSLVLNDGVMTWTTGTVTIGDGIAPVSNLPELFMQDYYTYLLDNDLLNSPIVNAAFVTAATGNGFTGFKASYTDPVALYNWSGQSFESLGYSGMNGYSQFFWDTYSDGVFSGGFFGTEPYKAKYATLFELMVLIYEQKLIVTPAYPVLTHAQAKAAFGFVFDGYFYGTQGGPGTIGKLLRACIPTPTLRYFVEGGTVKSEAVEYAATPYLQVEEHLMPLPSKMDNRFIGWYDNDSFNGDKIVIIPAGVSPTAIYYAKWEPLV